MSPAPAISPATGAATPSASGKSKGEAGAVTDEFAALLAGVTIVDGEAVAAEVGVEAPLTTAAEGEPAEVEPSAVPAELLSLTPELTLPATAPSTAPAPAAEAHRHVPTLPVQASDVAVAKLAEHAAAATPVVETPDPVVVPPVVADSPRKATPATAAVPATPATPASPATGEDAAPAVPSAGATPAAPATPASPATPSTPQAAAAPAEAPASPAPTVAAPTAPEPSDDAQTPQVQAVEVAAEPVAAAPNQAGPQPSPVATLNAVARLSASAGVDGPRRALEPTVVDLAKGLRSDGDGVARLVVRLDPPELGTVTLTLSARNGDVRIAVQAGDAQAALAIDGQQAEIRQALADEGFDLDAFSVRDFGSGAAYDQTTQRERDERGRGRGGADASAETDPDVPAPADQADDAGTWL